MGLERIETVFSAKTARDKELNLIGLQRSPLLNIYVTAGYPTLNDTPDLLRAIAHAGADLIELGMPYSDPLADGETIQLSSTQALRNAISIEKIFAQVKEVRNEILAPIILMGYYNQVLRFGIERFLDACVAAGVDGLILPDMPLEIYEREFSSQLIQRGLGISFLVTPRTPDDRVRRIDSLCRGFLYVVSSSSTTGSKASALEAQQGYFERLAKMDLTSPMLIGFNISDKKSLDETTAHAAGGIIGSAFIRALDQKNPSESASRFIGSLKSQVKS